MPLQYQGFSACTGSRIRTAEGVLSLPAVLRMYQPIVLSYSISEAHRIMLYSNPFMQCRSVVRICCQHSMPALSPSPRDRHQAV